MTFLFILVIFVSAGFVSANFVDDWFEKNGESLRLSPVEETVLVTSGGNATGGVRYFKTGNDACASVDLDCEVMQYKSTSGIWTESSLTCSSIGNHGTLAFRAVCVGGETCTPDWECSAWSQCTSGKQTRTCTDRNNCGGNTVPITEQSCTTLPANISIYIIEENIDVLEFLHTEFDDECTLIDDENCNIYVGAYAPMSGVGVEGVYAGVEVHNTPFSNQDFIKSFKGIASNEGFTFEQHDDRIILGREEFGIFNYVVAWYNGNKVVAIFVEDWDPNLLDDETFEQLEYEYMTKYPSDLYEEPVTGGECGALIDKVKYPSSYTDEGVEYQLNWYNNGEDNWWADGTEEKFKFYSAGWYTNFDEEDNYISYEIMEFDNKGLDLVKVLKEKTDYNICSATDIWSEDGYQTVYVCNWDALRNQENLEQYDWTSRQVYWTHNNILVQIYLSEGRWLSDEEFAALAAKRISDILDDIRDNQGEFIGWEELGIDYPPISQVEDSLSQCSSDLVAGEDVEDSCWECKIEPAICPEYGWQTRICRDYCSDNEIKEEKIYCNPGICSGCFVPRWFKSFDNVCIPYGFRFDYQVGIEKELVEISEEDIISEGGGGDDYTLEVISETEAIFTLFWDQTEYKYNLVEGQTVTISIPDWEDEFDLFVKNVVPSSDGEKGFVELLITGEQYVTVPTNVDAYCDIDGEVKTQKDKEFDGSWASCQNSYECVSNVCSNGECVDTASAIREVGAIKNLFYRVICRLANLFDEQDYDSCIADYLGGGIQVGDSILIAAPFYGQDVDIVGDEILMGIQNNGGEVLSSVEVELSLDSPSSINCASSNNAADSLGLGDSMTVKSICSGLSSGDRVSGEIAINYMKSGSSLDLTATGKISGVSE